MITPKQLGRQESFPNQVLTGAPVVLSSKTENYRALMFNQTTAAINVLLPNPDDTSIAFAIDVFNSGTADLSVNGLSVPASGANRIGWNPATSAFESVAGSSTGTPELVSGNHIFMPASYPQDTIYFDDTSSSVDFQGKAHYFDTSTGLWAEIGTGAAARALSVIGGAYTVKISDQNLMLNSTFGNITLTLPPVAPSCQVYRFMNGDRSSGTAIINGNGNNIRNTATGVSAATYTIPENVGYVNLVWDDGATVWQATTIGNSSSVTVASVAPATATAKAGDLWWDDANLEFYVLHDDGVTKAWVSTSGTTLNGDVVGPASATDNAIARYDTATGKLIQNSLVLIDDAGSITGVRDFDMTGRGLSGIDTIVGGVIDCSAGNTFTIDVNGATTILLTNLPPNTRTQTITILVNMIAGSITFPGVVKWPANATPTFTVGKKHLVTMITYDGAGSFYATAALDYA